MANTSYDVHKERKHWCTAVITALSRRWAISRRVHNKTTTKSSHSLPSSHNITTHGRSPQSHRHHQLTTSQHVKFLADLQIPLLTAPDNNIHIHTHDDPPIHSTYQAPPQAACKIHTFTTREHPTNLPSPQQQNYERRRLCSLGGDGHCRRLRRRGHRRPRVSGVGVEPAGLACWTRCRCLPGGLKVGSTLGWCGAGRERGEGRGWGCRGGRRGCW